MIAELRVRNLATIEDVTLPLGPGLNVLTGETGAGKSMLVDALALLVGGRSDSGSIRPGTGRILVEGVFDSLPGPARAALDRLGLEPEEGRLILRREVQAEGRSRGWINGSPVTAAVLSEIGALLVDIQGQHEAQSLLRPEVQRDLLDAFADAGPERNALAAARARWQELANQEAGLIARRDAALQRADYLRHVVAEIDHARLRPGEEESLAAEARRLGGVEQLGKAAHDLLGALEDEPGALAALARANRALAALERTDPETSSWRELLDTAEANLNELARTAREYAAGLEDDPARLAEVEARRDLLHRLRQKYGSTFEAVLELRRVSGEELELLDTADLDLRQIAARKTAEAAAVRAAADALTAKRKSASDRLARAVNRMLPRLGLPGGKFTVALDPLAEVAASGAEAVQFRATLNPGLEERALNRVASGGEVSRLMLSLRAALARQDSVPTLVFDEVDQGIGGEIGSTVAEALAEVARRHQVLVITHLPQIAARADRHLTVAKRARAGVATSDVSWIHGEDRVGELARMLGDADAETARRHALTMLSAGSRPRG